MGRQIAEVTFFIPKYNLFSSTILSLIATIKNARPDLLIEHSVALDSAIPAVAPAGFLETDIPHIEDIGQPTTACFLTRTDINPTKWYGEVLFCFSPLFSWYLGGYLKSMMVCAHFGIPIERPSFHEKEDR